MRTLIYKKNGKDLTFKNLELIKDKNNIYHTYIDDKYCLFIGEIKGVYFELNQYCNYRFYLEEYDYKNEYDSIILKIEQFLNDFENFVKNMQFPSALYIKVFELLELQTKELLNKRELYLKKLEERIKEQEILKLEEKRKKELEHIDWCENALKNFKEGSNITFYTLLDLIKFKKLDVHIRTLGTIATLGNNTINLNEGVFSKKTSQSTVNSIFKVIKNLTKN